MAYSIRQARTWAAPKLQAITQYPHIDIDYLLAEITGLERGQIPLMLDQTLSESQWHMFVNHVGRRAEGEPVAYILGHWGFWDYDFKVTADTLVPRSETEALVESILSRWSNNTALSVLELGVGSGVIAICLAKARPAWQITATDISKKALVVAQENARHLEVQNIKFFQGDWFAALPEACQFDLIVSNPPYIYAQAPHLAGPGLKFEPKQALVGGENGTEMAVNIIHESVHWLHPGGVVMIEAASTQAEHLKTAMQQVGMIYKGVVRDMAGLARVSIGEWPGEG